jgi:hypothetical protein
MNGNSEKNGIYKRHQAALSALGRVIESYRFEVFGPDQEIYETARLCFKLVRSRTDMLIAVSHDDPSKFSYARSDDDRTKNARRVKTSFQKIMKKIDPEMKDHLLAAVAAKLSETLNPVPVVILKGKNISRFYETSGIKSCMTGCGDTEMYSMNNNCAMAVVYDTEDCDGVLGLARCMLFKSDQGGKFRSRIYHRSPQAYEAIRDWTEANGYEDAYDKQSCTRGHTVTLTIPDSGFVPYMDIFQYTDDDPEGGNECGFSCWNGQYEARNTDGSVSGYGWECARCGERCREDDMRYVDGYGDVCDSCLDSHFSYCENCQEYVSSDSINTVHVVGYRGSRTTEFWCDGCISDDAWRCDHCDELYANDFAATDVTFEGRNLTMCEDCMESNGIACCENCGEYTDDVDDDFHCPDCREDDEEETEEEPAKILAEPKTFGECPDGYMFSVNKYGTHGGKRMMVVKNPERFVMPDKHYVSCNAHLVGDGVVGGERFTWHRGDAGFVRLVEEGVRLVKINEECEAA